MEFLNEGLKQLKELQYLKLVLSCNNLGGNIENFKRFSNVLKGIKDLKNLSLDLENNNIG